MLKIEERGRQASQDEQAAINWLESVSQGTEA